MMRLRLRILKEDGSISQIAWSLENHKAQTTTIAQLLEQVDNAVGLQSTPKDLSRFFVEVDGYECLSDLLVGKLLKDEDEVIIRSRIFQDPAIIQQVLVPSRLDNHSSSRSMRGTHRHDQATTDLVAINPRETSSSQSDDLRYQNTGWDTKSEKSLVSTDSNDELHDFLLLNPRGEVAMNYHHDHLLHQKWPPDRRPPLRTGRCKVCKHSLYRSIKIQLVEAFEEECFYCKIILEITRRHGSSPSADSDIVWPCETPWHYFGIAGEIHDSTSQIHGRERYADLFVLNDDMNHYGNLSVARFTGTNTGSEEGVLRALTWIQNCLISHERCENNSKSPLLRRVLDLESFGSGNLLSLRETDNEVGCYVCLSHCWGDSDYPAKTTGLTLKQNKENIPWSSLPKTFQDAIVFTRWLKIRYLWIDSLCIIQDSREDWLEESVKMVDIYRNSYLTLAATASSSDDGGLFYAVPPTQRLFGYSSDGIPYNFYLRPRITHIRSGDCSRFNATPRDVPLLSRAWAYQEVLLSPRVLHLSKQELRWECMVRTACEYRRSDPQSNFYAIKSDHSWSLENWTNTHELQSRWRVIIEEYSGLKLTYGKDKLPALSGLAKQMQRYRPGDKYLAGLWTQSLFSDLLWVVDNPAGGTVSKYANERRAPSWSWASIEFSARYPFWNEHFVRRTYTKLVDTTWVSASFGDTSELLSKEILLEGRLISGTWHDRLIPARGALSVHLRLASTDITSFQIHLDNFNWPEVYLSGYQYGRSRLATGDFCWRENSYRDRPSYIVTGIDAKVFCLPVVGVEYRMGGCNTSDYYLLLNQVRTGEGSKDRYKRFGLAIVRRSRDEEFPFKDWPMTRFTFI